MITRRRFLWRFGAAAVAITLARHLPGIAPQPLALADVFQAGDVFTVEGKYRIDPVTRRPDAMLGLQEFVITAQVEA